jgi:hypothetical protein
MNLNLHCIQIIFIVAPMSIISYVLECGKEMKLESKTRNLIQHNKSIHNQRYPNNNQGPCNHRTGSTPKLKKKTKRIRKV